MRRIYYKNAFPKGGAAPGAGKPLVSIVITNYKKEKYLSSAIKSCLAQSYKNIEILVVDDCSSESSSLKIARKLNDGRIRYFYTSRNYGHYACANYAMDSARGKYVTFLGADDTISKDHILDLFKTLIYNKLVAVCGMYSRYDIKGNVVKKPRLCEASIFFDRKRVLKDIGYFHMVRCAADSEYRCRIQKFYSSKKIAMLIRLSYKALFIEGCLTDASNVKTGEKVRRIYSSRYNKFHKNSNRDNLFYCYKLNKKTFRFPDKILVNNFDISTFKEFKI